MVILISTKNSFCAIGLVFKSIELRTKSGKVEKNWPNVYVFNLKVRDLIEQIN